jgi:hypothetical protein
MTKLSRRHTDTPIIVETKPRPISPRKIVPTRGFNPVGSVTPDRKNVLRVSGDRRKHIEVVK